MQKLLKIVVLSHHCDYVDRVWIILGGKNHGAESFFQGKNHRAEFFWRTKSRGREFF